MKIRVIGSSIVLDTFNAFGAQATNMSFGELYSAIQQGVLDGAECDHIDLLVEIFSKKQLNKLPIDVQESLIRAGKEATIAQRNAMEEKTNEAFIKLIEKGLVFNKVDKKLFKEKAQIVYAKNAAGVGGMEMINKILSHGSN